MGVCVLGGLYKRRLLAPRFWFWPFFRGWIPRFKGLGTLVCLAGLGEMGGAGAEPPRKNRVFH